MKYLASIRGTITDDDIRKCIRTVGLDPDDKKSVKHYSLGMKQRLGLAQAMMENPDILILDEPMNALDSIGIIELVYIVLQSVVKPGITGFFKIDLHIKCYIYLS